ncbi:MAG TPA: hypothetical protein VNY33_07545, partial [Gaiellaceae bacterium]|nr:hypothetical protein [Gaiellaceae bacterium]
LRDAGVSPEQSSGLLSAAAEATMHAVTLQALLDEPELSVTAEPSAADAERRPAPVALAA